MKCYLQYNWPGQSRLIGCLLGCHYQRFFTSDKSDSFKENPSTTTATTHWTLSILGLIFPSMVELEIFPAPPFEILFCRWARCRVCLCQVPLYRRILSKNVSWIGKLLLSSIFITPILPVACVSIFLSFQWCCYQLARAWMTDQNKQTEKNKIKALQDLLHSLDCAYLPEPDLLKTSTVSFFF